MTVRPPGCKMITRSDAASRDDRAPTGPQDDHALGVASTGRQSLAQPVTDGGESSVAGRWSTAPVGANRRTRSSPTEAVRIKNADIDATEARILEELARVAKQGVTRAELEKAQNIVLADFWRELATINGKASALGYFEVLTGSYENLFSMPEEIRAITAEQLQEVASKVFQRRNMTVGVLRAGAEESQ